MSLLDVNAEGLGVLSAHCASRAAELVVPPVGAIGPPGQSTSAAVAAVHLDVGMATREMAVRMRATAARLADAGTAFVAGDEESAAGLAL